MRACVLDRHTTMVQESLVCVRGSALGASNSGGRSGCAVRSIRDLHARCCSPLDREDEFAALHVPVLIPGLGSEPARVTASLGTRAISDWRNCTGGVKKKSLTEGCVLKTETQCL